jgi:hypothetical protein
MDRKRTFKQRAGAVEVALGVEDVGEVVEAVSGVGVVGAELGLADRKDTLMECLGLGVLGSTP